jgi:hypothetical protein
MNLKLYLIEYRHKTKDTSKMNHIQFNLQENIIYYAWQEAGISPVSITH